MKISSGSLWSGRVRLESAGKCRPQGDHSPASGPRPPVPVCSLRLCVSASVLLLLSLLLAACGAKGQTPSADGAPPPAQVENEASADLLKVDHPEQFPLSIATRRDAAQELEATGAVAADVSRNVPVISLPSA